MKLLTPTLAILAAGLLALSVHLANAEAVGREAPSAAASAQTQQDVEQVLWGCYLAGADEVGAGNVEAAKTILRGCFTDDMVWDTVMPPAYANLNFSTSNGADGFVDVANQIYRNANYSRVHHLITNVVVAANGADTLRVTSSAHAIHVFQNESAFSAVVKFTDDFVRANDKWMIKHRVMTVVAANEVAAWTP